MRGWGSGRGRRSSWVSEEEKFGEVRIFRCRVEILMLFLCCFSEGRGGEAFAIEDGWMKDMMGGRGFGILYIFIACGVAMQCDVPGILCPKCVATTGQWHCSLEPGTHTHRRRRDVS